MYGIRGRVDVVKVMSSRAESTQGSEHSSNSVTLELLSHEEGGSSTILTAKGFTLLVALWVAFTIASSFYHIHVFSRDVPSRHCTDTAGQ